MLTSPWLMPHIAMMSSASSKVIVFSLDNSNELQKLA